MTDTIVSAANSHSPLSDLSAVDRIYQRMTEATWMVDYTTGQLLYLNPAAERLYGRSHQDLKNQSCHWLETLVSEDRDRVMDCIFQHSEQWHQNTENCDLVLEYRIIRPDGEKRWVRSQIWSLTTQNQRCLQGITTDLTEYRQAQQHKLRLEKLTDNLPGVIYQYVLHKDGSSEFVYVSPGVKELYGLGSEAITANADLVFNLIHPDDLDDFRQSVAISAENLTPWKYEWRNYTASGQLKWISANSQPERRSNGDIVWDGMMFDITDRKQAQAERDRFFDCALDLFCIVGFDGYFKRLNPAWETTLGYSIDELKAQPFLTWVHPDDRKTTIAEAGNIAEGGNTLWFENRYRTHDGSYRWLAWKTVSFPEEQVMYAIARDITESKEIEIERERLIEILEASPDLISSADLDGKITYMNRGGKILLGLNPDTDIKQYRIEDFLPSEVAAQFANDYIPTTLEQGKWRGKASLRTVDGNSFPVSQVILAHEATSDREAYLSTIVRDISDIQAIEERLRQQEQFLRTIYDNQGNVVFVVDVGIDGVFRYASFNATARELLGIDQDQICGKTPLQVFGETTGQQLQQYYQQCLATQQRITYETTLILGDRELYFQEVLTPLKDDRGNINRLVVNSTDISDRRIAELALQTSEALHRHSARREKIVNHINQQIRQSLDLKTILDTSVREIYELLGVDRCYCLWYRQTDNKPQFEIGAEAKQDRLPSHLKYYSSPVFDVLTTVLQQQGSIQLNDVGKVKDVCTREQLQQFGYKSLLLFPIETGENNLAMLACSRETKAQSWQDGEVELLQTVCDNLAIAIQQAALYQQATTKTQELEHTLTQLQQTQAQLIQAEKMSGLGQLVAGVAHEINNPVSFIFGNLIHAQEYTEELLQLIHLYKDSIPEPPIEIQTYSEDIDLDYLIDDLPNLFKSMHSGAVRIREIVQSLRTFSRLDESETKTIDIHENLDSTLTILASRLRTPKTIGEIQVIRDYGDLPPVKCYAGPLNQVFMNLMANALDAIESKNESGGCLRIKTTRIEGDRVQIQIIDNGTGIKAETRDRIFDPFYTTKPIGKGTGLGLSISYQIIVERHQGQLICDSTPGEGTTFTIEIPC